jgi:LemA protein
MLGGRYGAAPDSKAEFVRGVKERVKRMSALEGRSLTRVRSALFSRITALLALSLLFSPGCGVNKIPTLDEQVKAAWSQVLNEYQRRADLIPNLVKVVAAYAHQEQTVLTQVTEARAKATQLQLPRDILSNPQAFHEFEQRQAELGTSLGRLLAVSESYPALKSDQNFLALQSQLEGTENRISVARRDYIIAVQNYNTELRTFPSRWTAELLYPTLKIRRTFTIPTQAQEVPQVKF